MIYITNIIFVLIMLCSRVFSEDLPSGSVSEGPFESITGSPNASLIWVLTPRTYYTTMGSESMFRGYFEVLRGRPAQSQSELDTLKLKLTLQPSETFLATGFDLPNKYYIQQGCSLTGTNQFFCVPLSYISSSVSLLGVTVNITVPLSAQGTDTSGITTSVDTVMLTDNNSFALITRCLNNTVRDWKLLTTSPTVSPELQQIAMDKATQLGFNSTNFRKMSF